MGSVPRWKGTTRKLPNQHTWQPVSNTSMWDWPVNGCIRQMTRDVQCYVQALFGQLTTDVVILTVLYSLAGLGIAIVNDFKSIEGDR